jgi:glycosyltransferase involved in cell wall biosynthesis
MSTNHPPVSCLMPTLDRRAFVPLAIEGFLGQDYPERELVILDDGDDPVADLIPDDPRVRYERLERRTVLGAKRNLACQATRGEVLLHWDDDDWYAPDRISRQVRALDAAGADVCGVSSLLFYDPRGGAAWRYAYPERSGRPWVAGSSLCYRRGFWERNPFPPIATGEDTRFLWGSRSRNVLALRDEPLLVAILHGANTERIRTSGSRWRRAAESEALALLGDSAGRYQAAARGGPPGERPPPAAGSKAMRLNLGCCDALLEGYVNVDLVPGPGVVAADLRQPWPWADGSVEQVRAWDVIEHLPDKIFTMNELWRVLQPGGVADIAVPTTDGPGAWQDPTHVSFWNRRSFLYYEAGNPYRERFAASYGIRAKFRTVQESLEQTVDGPRLHIRLRAVKP